MVDDNDVIKVLADFGISKQMSGSHTMLNENVETVGSFCYMAPEVMLGQESYGRKVDIWSLGATILELITGEAPWVQFDNPLALCTHILKNPGTMPVLPAENEITNVLRSFLLKC